MRATGTRNISATTVSRGFSATFDLLGDSVMIAGTDGRIVYVNAAFESDHRLHAARRRLAVPATCSSLVRIRANSTTSCGRRSAQGRPFRTIFTNRRKNGDLYEEGMIISPILGARSAKIAYYLAIGREIDALKQTFDAFLVLANNSPAGVYVVLQRPPRLRESGGRHLRGTTVQDDDRPAWEEFVAEADRERVAHRKPWTCSLDAATGPLSFAWCSRMATCAG